MNRHDLVAVLAEGAIGLFEDTNGRLRRARELGRGFEAAEKLVRGQIHVVTEDLVAEMDVERHYSDAGGLLLLLGQVRGGIRDDPDHHWSIASTSRRSQSGNGHVSLGCAHQSLVNL